MGGGRACGGPAARAGRRGAPSSLVARSASPCRPPAHARLHHHHSCLLGAPTTHNTAISSRRCHPLIHSLTPTHSANPLALCLPCHGPCVLTRAFRSLPLTPARFIHKHPPPHSLRRNPRPPLLQQEKKTAVTLKLVPPSPHRY